MLHYAMEQLLIEVGAPVNASELAQQVNKRGLYRKRDGSPVAPDQIRARARQYGHVFAQSAGIVSLVRWGDAAPERARAVTPIAHLPRQTTEPVKLDGSAETPLLAPESFRMAASVDGEVPDRAGLYAIRVRDRLALPEPFRTHSERRGHDLLYIGIARGSLSRRFLGQELRARGHGTFFRSIGAILGYRPGAGSLIGKKNTRNYTFAAHDELAIIDWINRNLLVNWVTTDADHEAEESLFLRKHRPLLNLQGNPGKLPELSALRAECVRIANTI